MTREQALTQLEALGVQVGGGGDVEALSKHIRSRPRRTFQFSTASQCGTKKRWTTPEGARQAAHRFHNPEVRPYRCWSCGAWHIGNPPRGRGR